MLSLLNSTPAFLTQLKDFFIAKSPVGNLPWWAVITIIAVVVIAIIVIICVSVNASKKKKKQQSVNNTVESDATRPIEGTDNVSSKEPVVVESGTFAGSLKTSDTVEKVEKTSQTLPDKEVAQKADEPVKEEVVQEPISDKATQEPIQAAKETEIVNSAKTEEVEAKAETVPPVKEVKKAKKEEKTAKPVAKKLSGNNKPVIVGVDALPKKYQEKLNKEEDKAKEIETVEKEVAADTVETFGKFVIKESSNPIRPYCFALLANNGQLLFESEPYKVKPRDNSIAAFKRNVKEGTFLIDEDKSGTFRYKLFSIKGTLIGVGETYKTKQACESSIESVKRFSETANLVEDTTLVAEEE